MTLAVLRDISEKRAADARLADALAAKEALLSEVNHRVKNSFQVVSSLLEIQASRSAEPEVREALREAQARIATSARLHQRLYATGAHDRVDVSATLPRLAGDVLAALGAEGVALETEADPDLVLPMSQATPLALGLTEMVTNAVKYAFPEGRGRIRVELRRQGRRLRATVGDDGPGLPPGFDPESSRGLGMTILRAMAQQVDGRLEIDRMPPGARFTLDMPLPEGPETR